MITDEATKGPNYPTDTLDPNHWLTQAGVVAESGQTKTRVRRHLKNGRLPSTKLDGPIGWYIVRRSDMWAWLADLTPSGRRDQGQ